MDNWNKTELISHMDRLGCFNAENAESPTCKKLLGMLIPKNESDGSNNDDYSIVNNVVIASYSLAIFLNCALLWMIYKDSLNRFRTPSSLLIANLAISDLLGSCFNLAIVAEISEKGRYNTSALTTLYLPWLVVTMAQSSYCTVVLIACERYAAIAHPFRYRDLVVIKHTLFAMLICWLLAFAISSPLFFVKRLIKLTTGDQTYAINSFILIAIILVLYPLTHNSLRRQRKLILTMNANNSTLRTNKLKVEKNFANTMFMNRHEVRATRHPPAPKKSVDRARTSNENGLTLTASIDKPGIGMENLTVPQSETQT